jgi:hypothetical protein
LVCKFNKTLKRAIQTLAFTLVLGCSISVVSASVTYQINNGGLESFNVTIDGSSINGALAGGISIHETAETPGGPAMPANYVTVCTDIGATLYLGNSYTYDTPATPFSGQTGVDPKWGTGANGGTDGSAAAAIQNAAYLFNTYGNLTGTGLGGNNEQKAALQLAVWAVLYDTTVGGSVTGSRFSVNALQTLGTDTAAISLADGWITDLNALSNVGNFGYTGYLLYPDPQTGVNNGPGQDGKPPQELLIAVPVPESPTVIAGALLLLPFAASTFKILRKKRAA